MIYKQLGNTGKQVSAVGFGAMRFRKEDYNKDPGICAELVKHACELGVNYIDTAPGYCDGMSEKIVGLAVSQMEKKPYISTKCGLWNATDENGVRRMIEQSLATLKVDKITVYNMWCIKTLDEYKKMTRPGGIYDGILRAKKEGLVEHICCTAHAEGDVIAEIAEDGKVEAVTLGYNALNFAYRRSGVAACHAKGLGVVVMNPLSGGVIPQYAKKFRFLAGEDGSVVTGALRFLIGQDAISIALPGPSSIRELEECVSAADNVTPVTEEKLEEMANLLHEELNVLCTGCGYCDSCPSGIPIPKMMDAFNRYLLSYDHNQISARLRDHWGISAKDARKCNQCGQCELACTQKLPIMARLKQI